MKKHQIQKREKPAKKNGNARTRTAHVKQTCIVHWSETSWLRGGSMVSVQLNQK